MQRMYIEVPYAEKDEAKLLGAKWDAAIKKWYFTDTQNSLSFQKWFTKKLTSPAPVVSQDRVTLAEFLAKQYKGAISLTYVSAKAFDVPFPLQSGLAKKYASNTAQLSSLSVGKKAKKIRYTNPKKKADHSPVVTRLKVFVPLCNCTTPPWEECEHTDALADSAMKEMLA
jgi:hypothetical protein